MVAPSCGSVPRRLSLPPTTTAFADLTSRNLDSDIRRRSATLSPRYCLVYSAFGHPTGSRDCRLLQDLREYGGAAVWVFAQTEGEWQ